MYNIRLNCVYCYNIYIMCMKVRMWCAIIAAQYLILIVVKCVGRRRPERKSHGNLFMSRFICVCVCIHTYMNESYGKFVFLIYVLLRCEFFKYSYSKTCVF